jgi:serine/threonine-protein kinase
MGEVYRARDVAITILPDDLNHPNIAQVYDFDESSDTRRILMELVYGETLQERLKHGPPPALLWSRIGRTN